MQDRNWFRMLIVGAVFFSGCATADRRSEDMFAARFANEEAVETIADAKWLQPYEQGTLPFASEPDSPLQTRLSAILHCPAEGNAKSTWHRRLNRDKNRVATPNGFDVDADVSFEAMSVRGDDEGRWSLDTAGVVEGFVRQVKGAGKETCNCKQGGADRVDTHIDVVADEDDEGEPLVVEITPRWRLIMAERGEDWSTATLKERLEGKRVRFTGWMFFDAIHAKEATNTHTGRARVWRRTAWELHPVTAIDVLD